MSQSHSPSAALTENHELERCTNASNGDVRLAGGPNEFEGRVEICQEGAWGQVCGPVNPKVVCRQLISPAVIPKNCNIPISFL